MTSIAPINIDFNDLAQSHGIDEVRKQIMQAINNPQPLAPVQPINDVPVANEPVIQPTPEQEFKDNLNKLLERYKQIIDDINGNKKTSVFDTVDNLKYSRSLFYESVGKKLGQAFFTANPQTINQSEINQIKADKYDQSRSSNPAYISFAEMLKRYMMVYEEDTILDTVENCRYKYKNIKMNNPMGFELWENNPKRKIIHTRNIVFDPTNTKQPPNGEEWHNTFKGLQIQPLNMPLEQAWNLALPILQLLTHLCEDNKEIFQWVLNWLAIPLQNLGTKMDTALIFHGHHQGAGKSLFFDQIMKRIYGEYSLTLGQGQLESRFNGWAENNLYILFEEVFSGNGRYEHMGKIKQLITGNTITIERKGIDPYEQDNNINAVFLSNDTMPLSLETTDRRHVVCYPKKPIPAPLLKKISSALADSEQTVIKAFYTVLMLIDTNGQNAHTPALMTDSKRDIIGVSIPSYERFYNDWVTGETEYPYISCKSAQLYKAYTLWCKAKGEKPFTLSKVMTFIGKRLNKAHQRYTDGFCGVKQAMVITVADSHQQAPNQTKQDWYAEQINKFQSSLDIVDPHVMPPRNPPKNAPHVKG